MLKYPCLVLDHDDTVVQSEATVNHPCFCRFLEQYRPGMTISFVDYVEMCNRLPFVEMCQSLFSLTEEELQKEYLFWKAYTQTHIPAAYPGIKSFLHNYRNAGGKICVVSMSSTENILRDYQYHFDLLPDQVFGCELPEEQQKPSPWSIEQIRNLYGFSSEEILVIDDMKFAVNMAKQAKTPIAFAGWGRKEFPAICEEMTALCDYSFFSVEELEHFLFGGKSNEN